MHPLHLPGYAYASTDILRLDIEFTVVFRTRTQVTGSMTHSKLLITEQVLNTAPQCDNEDAGCCRCGVAFIVDRGSKLLQL